MTRVEAGSAWEAQVSSQFPSLSRPQARVLALWSLGVVLAQRCGQTSVVLVVAGLLAQPEATVRQRLCEWCYAAKDKAGSRRGIHRTTLDVDACFAPLLKWVLATWGSADHRLALALDASSLGARFTVLALCVLTRGCAIPVAWAVVRAQEPDPWQPKWEHLLHQVQDTVPGDWRVVVLADRGLYAPWLFQAIVRCGWHPLLRINGGHGSGHYQVAGGGWQRLRDLLPAVGAEWSGRVTCFVEHALNCTVVARWEAGYREGWVVLTDLDPAEADVAWYALRTWIEAGFKDCKRGGWQWQLTRMRDPERVSRFWLVLAVATLWVVSVGTAAEETVPRAQSDALPPRHVAQQRATGRALPRQVSCFRRGITAIALALFTGPVLPTGWLSPDPWPTHVPPVPPQDACRPATARQKTYP